MASKSEAGKAVLLDGAVFTAQECWERPFEALTDSSREATGHSKGSQAGAVPFVEDGAMARLPPRAAARLQPSKERRCWATGTALAVDTEAGRRLYPFDLVVEDSQVAVYNQLLPPLLTEALEGNSGVVLCFGPPKGGKSHTLLGYGADPGLIPLTALEIFQKGLQVWVSYFEVKGGLLDRLAPVGEDDQVEAPPPSSLKAKRRPAISRP